MSGFHGGDICNAFTDDSNFAVAELVKTGSDHLFVDRLGSSNNHERLHQFHELRLVLWHPHHLSVDSHQLLANSVLELLRSHCILLVLILETLFHDNSAVNCVGLCGLKVIGANQSDFNLALLLCSLNCFLDTGSDRVFQCNEGNESVVCVFEQVMEVA